MQRDFHHGLLTDAAGSHHLGRRPLVRPLSGPRPARRDGAPRVGVAGHRALGWAAGLRRHHRQQHLFHRLDVLALDHSALSADGPDAPAGRGGRRPVSRRPPPRRTPAIPIGAGHSRVGRSARRGVRVGRRHLGGPRAARGAATPAVRLHATDVGRHRGGGGIAVGDHPAEPDHDHLRVADVRVDRPSLRRRAASGRPVHRRLHRVPAALRGSRARRGRRTGGRRGRRRR